MLESRMKPEPVEKLVTEKNIFVLLLWCAWFAEIKCIFSVYTDLLYIGDVVNIHFGHSHHKSYDFKCKHLSNDVAYKPFTDFV